MSTVAAVAPAAAAKKNPTAHSRRAKSRTQNKNAERTIKWHRQHLYEPLGETSGKQAANIQLCDGSWIQIHSLKVKFRARVRVRVKAKVTAVAVVNVTLTIRHLLTRTTVSSSPQESWRCSKLRALPVPEKISSIGREDADKRKTWKRSAKK